MSSDTFKSIYLEKTTNERIMTCGELKTLKFNILDSDLESLKNAMKPGKYASFKDGDNFKKCINSLSLYKNTKKGEKELNKLGPSFKSKDEVKIRPGARILKLQTEQDYRELIERYVNSDFKMHGGIDVVGRRAFGCIDINRLSKDYEGIYLSKEVSKLMDEELSYYSDNTFKNKTVQCSRVIALNPNILVKSNNEKVESYRKGVSGKIHNLSEHNKRFSKFVYRKMNYYLSTLKYFDKKGIEVKNHLIKEVVNKNTGAIDYYQNGKNVTEQISSLMDDLKNLNNRLNNYNGDLKFDLNYNNAAADLFSKKVTFGVVHNYITHQKYLDMHLNAKNISEEKKVKIYNSKDQIFSTLSEATILHELGHINNNSKTRFEDVCNKLSSNIYFDNDIKEYCVPKKYASDYMKEVLHFERLAWDYAFKEKPDCEILKWSAYHAYSSYVASHIQQKRQGYMYLQNDNGEKVKICFK